MRGNGSAVMFYHQGRYISGLVHGDDFVFVGDDEDLDWVQGEMVKWFDMKVRGRIGDGKGDQEEMVVLGRSIKWCKWGLEYKADGAHRKK